MKVEASRLPRKDSSPQASFPGLLWKSHFQQYCLGVRVCVRIRALLAHPFMRVIANRPARLTSWTTRLMLQLKCPPFIRPDVWRWGKKKLVLNLQRAPRLYRGPRPLCKLTNGPAIVPQMPNAVVLGY